MLIENSINERYMNTLNFGCFPKALGNFQKSHEFFQQVIFLDHELQVFILKSLKGFEFLQQQSAVLENAINLRDTLINLIEFGTSLEEYHDLTNKSYEERLYYAVVMSHLYYLNSQPEKVVENTRIAQLYISPSSSSSNIQNDFVQYLTCRYTALLGLSDVGNQYNLWSEYFSHWSKPFDKSSIAASYWLDVLFGGTALLISQGGNQLLSFNGIKSENILKNNLILIRFSNHLMKNENKKNIDSNFRLDFSTYIKKYVESVISNENHFPDANSENDELNIFVYNLYESLDYVPNKYHILSGQLSKKLLINLTQKSYQSQIVLRTLIKTLIDREEYDEAYAAFKTCINYIDKEQEQHNGYIHDIMSIIDIYSTCILKFNPLNSFFTQPDRHQKFKYVTRESILQSLESFSRSLKRYLEVLSEFCELRYDDYPNKDHISFLYQKYNENLIMDNNSNFIKLVSKAWHSLGYYYYYLCSYELPNSDMTRSYTEQLLGYYKNSLIIDSTGNLTYLFKYALTLSYNRSIEQAVKLCKFIIKRYPESFKTWNLLSLLNTSLETYNSGEGKKKNTKYQFNVTINGSVNETMNGSANGTVSSNIHVNNIKELERIINNALNIAGIYLVKRRKSNLPISNEIKLDILQLKLTQLSIWESMHGVQYILEYLPEVFILYNELFDMNIELENNAEDTNLRINAAKWSHRPSFIDPTSNATNEPKHESHLSKEKELAKERIKRISKITKHKEKKGSSTNDNSIKKLNLMERGILQDIWLWSSRIYFKRGLIEEAKECIIEAERIHEPNIKTFTSLGLLSSKDRKFLALQEFERSLEILNDPINYYRKKDFGTTLLGLCKLIILDDQIDNSLFISTKDLSSGLIRLKNYLENYSQSWPFGYNSSEVWWYLSLIYEKIDDKVMLAKSLWKCVELEDYRPARDFSCCDGFIV